MFDFSVFEKWDKKSLIWFTTEWVFFYKNVYRETQTVVWNSHLLLLLMGSLQVSNAAVTGGVIQSNPVTWGAPQHISNYCVIWKPSDAVCSFWTLLYYCRIKKTILTGLLRVNHVLFIRRRWTWRRARWTERMMEIKMIQWTIQSNSRTFLSLILIPEICWNFLLNDIGPGVFLCFNEYIVVYVINTTACCRNGWN